MERDSVRKIELSLKLESDRMIYLDLLRIASSYLIIVYHFQNQMSLGSAAANVQSRLDGFTLAVDLFFALSGFVISSVYSSPIRTRQTFGIFLFKRIARLAPLHWSIFAIFAIFGALNAAGYVKSNHPELYEVNCILPNVMFLHSFGICKSLTFNYVSWSISAEMGMYLIFPFLTHISGKKSGPISILVVLTTLYLLSLERSFSWLEWSFDFGVLRALPSFLLGMTAYQYRYELSKIPRAAVYLTLCCVLFVGACLLQAPKPLLLPLVYVIVLLGIGASEQPATARARRLAPLGQLTYSLYMLHPLVQTVLLTGVGATLLKLHGVPMTLFVLATLPLMLPIAWLSLVIFERPVRRRLTRRLVVPPRDREGNLFTPDSRW
jgi:peptidoglycan/LPS O-acetylase OafA/YrhL